MLPDQLKVHTMKVHEVIGPLKEYPAKGGIRQRYDIKFVGGYVGEYCPFKTDGAQRMPAPGGEMTFRIVHRSQKGDEIDYAQIEDVNPGVQNGGGRVYNMSGHPATIALNAAMRLAEINAPKRKGEEEMILPSDVMEDAEAIHTWLVRMATTE